MIQLRPFDKAIVNSDVMLKRRSEEKGEEGAGVSDSLAGSENGDDRMASSEHTKKSKLFPQ
jgi:hypothetical protein